MFPYAIPNFFSYVVAQMIFIGSLFIVVWGFKSLTEKQLWKWGWILLVLGILASIVLTEITR